jgi:sugar phosphate isomerase/epimerase
MLSRSGICPKTIHAPTGNAHDFSALDEKVYQNAVRSMGQSIALAVELDVPIIVVHASFEPIPARQRVARVEQARRAMAEMGDQCQKAGKKIAVELLPRSCIGNTVEELFTLLDGLDRDTFGVCLDVNHVMDRYQNLAADVGELGDTLMTLHLSDFDGVDEKHWLPGRGVIDWTRFMEALRDIDYGGPFNYECQLDGGTPQERIESLENNFEWLCNL